MNKTEQMHDAITTDGVWPKGLEIYCLMALRMNFDPRRFIRQWFKVWKLEIDIDLFESEEKTNKTKIFEKFGRRPRPRIIMAVQRVEGFVKFVRLYAIISGKHDTVHDRVLTSDHWEKRRLHESNSTKS